MKTMTAVPGSGRRWVERRRVEAAVAAVVIVVVMFMLALVLVLVLVVLVVVGVGVGVELKKTVTKERGIIGRQTDGMRVATTFRYVPCRSRIRTEN